MIRSIKKQNYPYFECLLVDNGSTDDSYAVMAREAGDDVRFSLHQTGRNLGHLGGGLWALEHARGSFVCFADADDVLLPDFLEVHLQAHLMLPSGVAFTSSQVVEIDSGGHALTSRFGFFYSDFARGGLPPLAKALQGLRLGGISEQRFGEILAAITLFNINDRGWMWSPGTASVYRRSALELTKVDLKGAANFRGVDCFFNQTSAGLLGSANVDIVLSGYRIHAGNSYVVRESLASIHNTVGANVDDIPRRRRESAAYVFDNAEQYLSITGGRFWSFIDAVIYPMGNPDSRRAFFSHPDVVAAIRRALPHLQRALGVAAVRRALRKRLKTKPLLDLLRAAEGGRLSSRTVLALVRDKFERLTNPKARHRQD